MDWRLEPVDKLLPTVDEIGDNEREASFAVPSIDWKDPTTMYWAAACLVARAEELEE